jgi:ribosome-associated protein
VERCARGGHRDVTSAASAGTRASGRHARLAAGLCVDNRARDVVVLELAGLTDMTDYFVIASGTSDTHVKSIAENVMAGMAAAGARVQAAEGLAQGRWVVLDFVDFVVHVFHPTLRSFYQLERLWGDAPALALNP